jgi:hypothetical protein
VFDQKKEDAQRVYRNIQADLPYEDKVRLVVMMQKVAREWARQGGRPEPYVWELPDEETKRTS